MSPLLGLVLRLALAWSRLLAAGLSDDQRDRRLGEQASYLSDLVADARRRGKSERAAALEVALNVIVGLPDDVEWSVARMERERLVVSLLGLLAVAIGVAAFVFGGARWIGLGGSQEAMSFAVFVAVMFVVLGLLAAFRPDLAFEMRAWTSRVVLGAQVTPGGRTLAAYRIVGVAFAVIGAYQLYTLALA